MRWAFPTMGTVVSVAISGAEPAPQVRAAVEREFHERDAEFSRYRPDSPISRMARGECTLEQAGEPIISAYAAAAQWRARTAGDFSPHRPDGTIDLDGIVKALAIEAAGAALDSAGIPDWSLGCGGDVLAARPGWTVGIADPDRHGELLSAITLAAGRRAVATSGTSERGEHVWRTDRRATFRQVTVVADDIVTADVLATAILSGGPDALDRAALGHDIDVLAWSGDAMLATPGMRRLISAAA